MFKPIICFALFLSMLPACNNSAKTDKTEKDNLQTKTDTTPPRPGSDRDEHGCIGSAGYTWSIVKNDCIRIFEVGMKLEPKDPKLDQNSVAYAIFSNDKQKVEMFIPGQSKGTILELKSKEGEMQWTDGNMSLMVLQGKYQLREDASLMYEGGSK